VNNTIDNPHAVITEKENVLLATEKIPALPGPGEMLIKTRYSLISPGTELAIFQHTHVGFADPANLFAKYPFRSGYAAVGEIIAVCPEVARFKKGDQIFYKGRHQAFSIVKPADAGVVLLPAGIDPKLALFARMAQITAAATEISDAKPGETVAVVGQGLVGNLVAQLFQRRGCKVLGIDLIPQRCEVAKKCGLNSLCVAGDEAVPQVRKAFAGNGARTVIEATGHPLAVETALRMAATGGEVILLGSTRGRVELDLYTLVHVPGITIRGAHERVIGIFGGGGRQRELLAENLQAIASGALKVAPLLSHEMDYREIGAAYHRLCDQPAETLSIVLDWPQS
jgi:2-desacetyl-2-hydroxyethyl bacteriochlorophyllide A dehydrogenase